ncbi:hypothetical protein GCM10022247_73100 [Allokutzneria multivorans]|uniref:Uncharacterized protein n=1 Tax=Allokutzneria multivorans TaxID=1142134 RepID=A0ABP7U5Z6_9PSEU
MNSDEISATESPVSTNSSEYTGYSSTRLLMNMYAYNTPASLRAREGGAVMGSSREKGRGRWRTAVPGDP